METSHDLRGIRPGARTGSVKSEAPAVRDASTAAASWLKSGFLEQSENPNLIQELTMADVAFVVTTIAVFALVALIAKGVAKL
ncbi:hypothetical protein [Streptomyces sp. NPDC020681]|uniref:hypothetical protein n=1 Tax=Streptomyces sp. NPDC020681 TaxID=3365083 RepID=UPI0037A78964